MLRLLFAKHVVVALAVVLCLLVPWLQATLTVLETNETFVAYDFPLEPTDQSKNLKGPLVLATVGQGCKLTIDLSQLPDIASEGGKDGSSTKSALALIDFGQGVPDWCISARDILTHNSDLKLPPISAFIFFSAFNLPYEVGGADEYIFTLYQDSPEVPQAKLIVEMQTYTHLRGLLTDPSSKNTLTVSVYDTTGPWNRYFESAQYLGMRWTTMAIRCVFTLYTMFCIYKLLTQHGFRKRFQLSMYTTIFFHLIFFMIAPRETLFSRSQLIIHSLSWSSMHVTFFLLIYRWAQVAQNIYHTRWFKVYFVVMYGYAVVIVLWLIASIVATYEAGQGRIGGTFVAVCRIYLTGSYLVVILVFFSILAFWVVVNQWKFYRTSAGASSLIRLSLFTVFVAIGWLVQVISLSLVMTIWAKPYIKNFVAQSVLFCLVNFWITIVVFWQMPLSSAGTSRNFWSSNSRSNPTPFKDNSDNTYALPSTLDKARGNLLENKADFYGPTERQSFEEVIGSTPLDSQKTVQSQPRGNNANSLDNWPTDLHLPATVLASSYELKQII